MGVRRSRCARKQPRPCACVAHSSRSRVLHSEGHQRRRVRGFARLVWWSRRFESPVQMLLPRAHCCALQSHSNMNSAFCFRLVLPAVHSSAWRLYCERRRLGGKDALSRAAFDCVATSSLLRCFLPPRFLVGRRRCVHWCSCCRLLHTACVAAACHSPQPPCCQGKRLLQLSLCRWPYKWESVSGCPMSACRRLSATDKGRCSR